MTQPTKREQLVAMRLEEFKAHLRTIRRWTFGTNQRRTAAESVAGAQSPEAATSVKAKAALRVPKAQHGAMTKRDIASVVLSSSS